MTARPLVLDLHVLDQGDERLVGSKAFNLARMLRNGLPVPGGFGITTEAYRITCLENIHCQAALSELGTVNDASIDGLHGAAARIQTAILNAPLTSELEQVLLMAWDRLGQVPVAVRSSASAEDLGRAAFAGQYESFLGVATVTALIDAMRKCWASLWSARATFYRFRQGIEDLDVSMAVLVQRMIHADSAGVIFTIDPVTQNADEIHINAAIGPGQAVVDGSVTPDAFVIDKATLRIKLRRIAARVAAPENGMVRRDTSFMPGERPSLNDQDLRSLATLTLRIEALFGVPQDIEWVSSGGAFYVVQARPITTTGPAGETPPRFGYFKRAMAKLILEYFPLAPYPFDRSVILPLLQATLDVSREFGLAPPRAEDVIAVAGDDTIKLQPRLPTFGWGAISGVVRGIARAVSMMRLDPKEWLQSTWSVYDAQLRAAARLELPSLGDQAVASALKTSVQWQRNLFAGRRRYFLGAWLAMLLFPVVLRLVRGREGARLYFDLLGGLDHPTARMNAALRRLAETMKSMLDVAALSDLQAAGDIWQTLRSAENLHDLARDVEAFLEEFGARTEVLIPLPSCTPWRENPDHVLRLVLRLARDHDVSCNVGDREQAAFEQARRQVVAARRFWATTGVRRTLLFLIDRNRAIREERDWVIYAYERAVDHTRRTMQEVGLRLHARGLLRSHADVRFLTIGEAMSLLDLTEKNAIAREILQHVGVRKSARRRTVELWRLPADGRRRSRSRKALLRGTGASPGRATGRARVILSDQDFGRLAPGEILVCRATAPAWTPLFATAGGVVTDVGGPLSHAAIVAREYRIPAVLGTEWATATLRDGATYTVDGTTGEVHAG